MDNEKNHNLERKTNARSISTTHGASSLLVPQINVCSCNATRSGHPHTISQYNVLLTIVDSNARANQTINVLSLLIKLYLFIRNNHILRKHECGGPNVDADFVHKHFSQS